MYALKLDRAAFAFFIVLVNSGSAFLGVLVNRYLGDPVIAGAATVFISAISTGAIVYLGTEETKLPA